MLAGRPVSRRHRSSIDLRSSTRIPYAILRMTYAEVYRTRAGASMTDEPAIEAIGLEKSYGAVRVLRRRRPARRARQRVLAARPQRRGQDDDGADPRHARCARTPGRPGSRASTSSPSSGARPPQHQPHRPVRGRRRAADRRGEPAHDGRGCPASGARRARARARELLAEFDLVDAGRRRVATYSGGMRRRLDLAASLVAQPVGDLPRRADHRPGPAQPPGDVGGDRRARRLRGRRSSSRRSTSRRPTGSPTASPSSTAGAWSPRAPRPSSSSGSPTSASTSCSPTRTRSRRSRATLGDRVIAQRRRASGASAWRPTAARRTCARCSTRSTPTAARSSASPSTAPRSTTSSSPSPATAAARPELETADV